MPSASSDLLVAILLVGPALTLWIVTLVQVRRAEDPRDRDGRRVEADEQRLLVARRRHRRALQVLVVATIASFVVRLVVAAPAARDPATTTYGEQLLPLLDVLLASGLVVVAMVAGVRALPRRGTATSAAAPRGRAVATVVACTAAALALVALRPIAWLVDRL